MSILRDPKNPHKRPKILYLAAIALICVLAYQNADIKLIAKKEVKEYRRHPEQKIVFQNVAKRATIHTKNMGGDDLQLKHVCGEFKFETFEKLIDGETKTINGEFVRFLYTEHKITPTEESTAEAAEKGKRKFSSLLYYPVSQEGSWMLEQEMNGGQSATNMQEWQEACE